MSPDQEAHPPGTHEPGVRPTPGTPSVFEQTIDTALAKIFRFDNELDTWLEIASEAVLPPPPLGQLGPYTLLEELGRGGQGVVFRAIQPGTDREIALKRLSSGMMFGSRDRERFSREVHALTRLAHPNVVTVYAAEVIDGHPLLIMELVDGTTLDRWAEGLSWDAEPVIPPAPEAVLTAFALVCDAVAHAHQRGVIHRDIKPSNVLIDRDGSPRVVDFGVARLLNDFGERGTVHTVTGFVGTPTYASPEQLDGRGEDIDSRTDVYSLGVLLYRLLAGREPFVLESGLRTILERVARGPARLPSQIVPTLNRDLDWIVLKALDIDPARRYQTVDAMAQDIRHCLAGEAVIAHPPSRAYLASKFVRRNRTGVAAAAIVAFALVAGSVISTASMLRERTARLAEAYARRHAELRQYIAEIRAASAAIVSGDMGTARGELAITPEHLRGWEWQYLLNASDESEEIIFDMHIDPISRIHVDMSFAVDERWMYLSNQYKQRVELFDISGTRAAPLAVLDNYKFQTASVWPDDNLIIDTEHIIEYQDGRLHPRVLLPIDRRDSRRTPCGLLVVAMSTGEVWITPWTDVRDWIEQARATGQVIDSTNTKWRTIIAGTLEHPTGLCLAVMPRYAVVGSMDGRLQLIDTAIGKVIAGSAPIGETPSRIRLDPEGGRLGLANFGKRVLIYSVPEFELIHELHGHEEVVSDVAFLNDGRHIVSSSWDGTLRVWDLETAETVRTLRGHAGAIRRLEVIGDGAAVLTLSDDGTVRRWSMDLDNLRREPSTLRGFSRLHSLAMTPEAPSDGWIVVVSNTRENEIGASAHAVNMRNLDDRRLLHRTVCMSGPMYCSRTAVDVCTDGRFAALGDNEGQILIYDLHHLHADPDRAQEPITVLDMTDRTPGSERFTRVNPSSDFPLTESHVDRVRFSPDGGLVAASAGPAIEVFDLRRGETIARACITSEVTHLAFSPEGDRLALAAVSGSLATWVFGRDTEPLWHLTNLSLINDVEWSPDGRTIALATTDGTALLIDTRSMTIRAELRGHPPDCRAVAFSPDSARIVTAGFDRTLRLWHAESGVELLTLRGHDLFVDDVAFSADGRWIVSVSPDNSIRLWDGRPTGG